MKSSMFSLAIYMALAMFSLLIPDSGRGQCSPRMGHGIDLTTSRPPTVVMGLIRAMRTPGENARVAAVRDYLKAVLKNGDWRTKFELSNWLNDADGILDPRPFEDLLGRLHCNRLLDWVQLRNERGFRDDVFSEALGTGWAYMPRGTTVAASDAVTYVSEYGMSELEGAVREFYGRDWIAEARNTIDTSHSGRDLTKDNARAYEHFKTIFPYRTFELSLRLHAGGKDYEDANRLAAKRLAEMPTAEFRDHIENDPGFSGVFWRIAGDACAVNVFTGEQSDACEDIIKVYVHQMWLYRDLKKAGKPTSWPKALDGLGSCIYKDVLFGDYAVPRDLFMTAEHKRRLQRTRERVKRAREEHKLKERTQADRK